MTKTISVDCIPRSPMSSAKETVNKPHEIYQRAKLTVKQQQIQIVSKYIFHKVSSSNETYIERDTHIPSEDIKTKTQRGWPQI